MKKTNRKKPEPMNTVLRVHPITRKKINKFREHKPAFNLSAAVDQAVDALLEKEGIRFGEPAAA